MNSKPHNLGKVTHPLPHYEAQGAQEPEVFRDECPCRTCRRIRLRRRSSDRADGWVIAQRVTWIVLILATGLYTLWQTGNIAILAGVW